MLCQDLSYKVALVDEAYNLFKNVQLSPEEEVKIFSKVQLKLLF